MFKVILYSYIILEFLVPLVIAISVTIIGIRRYRCKRVKASLIPTGEYINTKGKTMYTYSVTYYNLTRDTVFTEPQTDSDYYAYINHSGTKLYLLNKSVLYIAIFIDICVLLIFISNIAGII